MRSETLSVLVKALKQACSTKMECDAWNIKAKIYLRCAVAPVKEFADLYEIGETFDIAPEEQVMIFRIGHFRNFEDIRVSQSYISLLDMYYSGNDAVVAEIQRLKTAVPFGE